MKNKAYLIILFGLALEILPLIGFEILGLGYVTFGLLLVGLYYLYKDRKTSQHGTVVGHSLSGIILLVIGGLILLFVLGNIAMYNLSSGYTIYQKALGMIGLIIIVLGLYSFAKASQLPKK